MTRPTSIVDRIRAAVPLRVKTDYHDAMAAVFPSADYPEAWRGASKGGPPGCAMAFGAALRRAGVRTHHPHSNESLPPSLHGKPLRILENTNPDHETT